MKKSLLKIQILFFSFLLINCTSVQNVENSYKKIKFSQSAYSLAFSKKDYKTCISMLNYQNKGDDDIDILLDIAMLQHYDRNYEESKKTLNYAAKLIDESFTKSVTKSIGAKIFNENIADYSGNVYEYLFVNAFNSLNYLKQNNLEEALVEIRKISVKLKEYVNKYGQLVKAVEDLDENSGDGQNTINSAIKRAGINMNDVRSSIPKPPTDDDIYSDSAFIRYLSLVLRTMYGDENNLVDAKYLASLNPNFTNEYYEQTNIPEGFGRVNVLSLSGQIAKRKPGEIRFPFIGFVFPNLNRALHLAVLGKNREQKIKALYSFRFTFPKFDFEQVNIYPINVKIGEQVFNLCELENFDLAVKKDVDSKAYSAYVRSISRSSVKKISTMIASESSLNLMYKKKVPRFFIVTAAQTALQTLVAIDKSENPDVRQCSYFPKTVYAGGIYVKPGIYTIEVEYSNGTKDVIENIEVKNRKINLIESVCLK